jgi:GGDEF domain-containing protein
MERCYRYGRHFSLLVFQHLAASGDRGERLRETLSIMAARLRSTDIIARVADDTIAVVLVETDPPGAARALERLADLFSTGGEWRSEALSFPTDSPAIEALPFLAEAA